MLTEKEMRTTLSVVEAQINSCPLTHCSDDTSDPLPLTPAEIIVDRPFQAVTLKSEDVEGSSLRKNLLHAFEKSSKDGWQLLKTMVARVCDPTDGSQEMGTNYSCLTSWGRSPSEWWPPSKTTLETWTDKRNIQRKRSAAPFCSWKDDMRSVQSTNHRTPHIRSCWHFKVIP